jgi:hypothetical protein
MDTVCNGDFFKHDLRGGREKCWVTDILVHTDPVQNKPVVIIADDQNYELRTYDLASWQCLSQCTMPAIPMSLYQSDGGVYVHCNDGTLYQISSVSPLAISTSPHGHVTGVRRHYNCISHLGPGRLVAVCHNSPPAVHVIDLHGRQLADITTCGGYHLTNPRGLVCGGGRVVVIGWGKGKCLDREWDSGKRVVCAVEGVGSWSVRWMHDVFGFPLHPVISPGGGTVIVPCRDRIVSLSLETGAVVQQVYVAPGFPDLGLATCIYGERLLVGCCNVVVEFSLQGQIPYRYNDI